MANSVLDDPAILARVFYPQAFHPPAFGDKVHDGTIPVEAGVVLGYRLFAYQPYRSVIVFFHGNGEIAPDYDMVASYFNDLAGVSLLVIDYRGYGWSTGQPTFSTLLSDTEAVYRALPVILEHAALEHSPCYVMGRSLGSAPAIHLAHAHPDAFRGLILESGFADVPSLLRQLGLPHAMIDKTSDEIGNLRKLAELKLPLLVIHGEQDTLLPIVHGEQLYLASRSRLKDIVRIPNAGHNDILIADLRRYFGAIADFVDGNNERSYLIMPL